MKYDDFLLQDVTVNYDRIRIPLSSMQRKERKGNYRYYGAQGVIDYVDDYLFDGEYLLIAEDGENLKSKKQKIAQIVRGRFWVNNHAHILQSNGKCELKYLCYLLNNMDLSSYITGTAQPKLNQASMNVIPLRLPSVDSQRKVIAIIDAVDNRIEANKKINDNLQQQAHSIFRKAFIDIEELPTKWSRGCLLDIADYLNGLAMQKFRPSEDENGIPVLKIKELRQGLCDASSELCSPRIKPDYIIHDGDVVFSWSGSLLVDIWCGGTCGLNQHLFKVTSKTYDKWFYYLWTVHHLDRFIAIAADKATTMGHIKREELSKAEVVIPSREDYEEIGAVLNPMVNLMIANRIENRILASLRDELLPKLMSGEIDVSSPPLSS